MQHLIKLTGALALCACMNLLAGEAPAPPDPRTGVFSAEFPFESHFVDVLGSRMHYIDEGEGTPIVFLHGNPTSSYLWRNVITYVRGIGRVIAVDNIGFGKSDKPQLAYTFQDHYRYIETFIEQLGLDDIVLVVHDWGSVLGLNYARLHERNVRGVVFMEAIIPPLFPIVSPDGMGELFQRFRDPVEGKVLLMEQNVFVESILANAALTRHMTEAEMNVYRSPFADVASRFPIYVWPNELPIGGAPARNVEVVEAVGKWLERSRMPKLLQYARPGAIVTPERAAWMAEHYRNLETQFVGYGSHYIQEDNPEAIGRGIADWYRRHID
ncbi:MAG: haloalkane dehalogenase [Pseudomonadales bacterium]